MYQRTTAFVTRRAMKIHNVSVAKAVTLTRAQVKQLGSQIDRLVSNGSIEAIPEVHARRGAHGPRPSYVQPGLRNATRITATVDGAVQKKRNFVTYPVDSYVFDMDDGNNAVADADGTLSHTYAAAGIYDVTAAADYQVGTVQVVVTNLAVSVSVKTATFTATPAAAGPFTFDFGDGTAPVVDADGAGVVHVYATAATRTASVTCAGTTQVATVSVVTT